MAVSDGLAKRAGHHAACITEWEAATPAVLVGCITLHAGETPKGTATSAHISTAITEASAPMPNTLISAGDCHYLGGLLVFSHFWRKEGRNEDALNGYSFGCSCVRRNQMLEYEKDNNITVHSVDIFTNHSFLFHENHCNDHWQ